MIVTKTPQAGMLGSEEHALLLKAIRAQPPAQSGGSQLPLTHPQGIWHPLLASMDTHIHTERQAYKEKWNKASKNKDNFLKLKHKERIPQRKMVFIRKLNFKVE